MLRALVIGVTSLTYTRRPLKANLHFFLARNVYALTNVEKEQCNHMTESHSRERQPSLFS